MKQVIKTTLLSVILDYMRTIEPDEVPEYIQDVIKHVKSDKSRKHLKHYGMTGTYVFGYPRSGLLVLLAGSETWGEIMRIPGSHTIPQTVIGAYTHTVLPLTAHTKFAWRPNEALAIAANKFAYPSDFAADQEASSRLQSPEAVPRTYHKYFDPDKFDEVMDVKRAQVPYVYAEPVTYRTLALPKCGQPAWHQELQSLCEHLFWKPELHLPYMDLLVLPQLEVSNNLLRPKDIIRSMKITGRGWNLLHRADIVPELQRVQHALAYFSPQ